VLDPEHLTGLVRRLRRSPILPKGAGVEVALGRQAIERLLPHRPPMLLVDGIEAVDLSQQAVRGTRALQASDLGFAGHFDDAAIYPGVLTVEAMGQLALTLLHFIDGQTTVVLPDAAPARVRATHIHHATFLAPLVPGDRVTLHAQVVESGMTLIAAGQAYKNETLAAFAISEVYVDE
jgi:3-hydroxyacyl-[acyl-carrier-protein] dehydratase